MDEHDGIVKEDLYFINEDIKQISGGYVSQNELDVHLTKVLEKDTKVFWDEELNMWLTEAGSDVPARFVERVKK